MSNKTLAPLLERACFGFIVCAQYVNETIPKRVVQELLDRHLNNDWGEIDDYDTQLNTDAVKACHEDNSAHGRIVSSYTCPVTGQKVGIITYLQHEDDKQRDQNYCSTVVYLY